VKAPAAATPTTCRSSRRRRGVQEPRRLVSRGRQPDPSAPGPPALDDDRREGQGARRDDRLHGGPRLRRRSSKKGPEGRGASLTRLKDVFEPGSLYVELQDHGLPEQPILNGILVDLARSLDLPLVATNDVHYAERDRRRGAPLPLVHQDGALVRRGEGAPPRLERDVPEVAKRDGADVLRRTPKRSEEHARDRRALRA
jgi:hypothetical protein